MARHEVITYRGLWGRYMQMDGNVNEQAHGWDFDRIWDALSLVPDNTAINAGAEDPDMDNSVLEDLAQFAASHRANASIDSVLSSASNASVGASRMPSLNSQSEGVPFMRIDASAEATNALHQSHRSSWPPPDQAPHPLGLLGLHGHQTPERDWFCSLRCWDTHQAANSHSSSLLEQRSDDQECCGLLVEIDLVRKRA